MKKKIYAGMYRIMRWMCRKANPVFELSGTENLPEENVVLVGNHAQMYGPIGLQLYAPRPQYTWCTAEMMNLKEVPAYAFEDFWSDKPKYIRWFFHLASYMIAPFSVIIFNNAETIPVYKDRRILSTLNQTIQRLMEGNDIVIFSEGKEPRNNIINQFQTGFLNIAKRYTRVSGKLLTFVPMYVAPELKKIFFGKGIVFDTEAAPAEEQTRVCEELMTAVTELAASLPLHTVVPYINMPKKSYPKNLPVVREQKK